MQSDLKTTYSKYLLRNSLREKSSNFSLHMSVLVDCLKSKVTEGNCQNVLNTKEQLYALGLTAIQIHKYFELKTDTENNISGWCLKKDVIIKENHIKTIKQLLEQILVPDKKIA